MLWCWITGQKNCEKLNRSTLFYNLIKQTLTNTMHLSIPCQNSKSQMGKAPTVSKNLNLRQGKEMFFTWGPPLFFLSITCSQKKLHRCEWRMCPWVMAFSLTRMVEFFPSGNCGQYQLSLYAFISNCLKSEGLDAIVSLRWVREQKERANECAMY